MNILIARRGAELEALLNGRDPKHSGEIPVKAFSECLRSWDRSGDGGGSQRRGEKGGELETLSHADRKVLYRRWSVKGRVRYDDFLRASGYYDTQLPRYSKDSVSNAASTTATAKASAPARIPSVGSTRGKRVSLTRGDRAAATARSEAGDEEEDRGLQRRAKVVLVHLSEVGVLLGVTLAVSSDGVLLCSMSL